MTKTALKKIFLTLVIAMVAFYGAAYLFMLFLGKSIIINRLEAATHKKVSMGQLIVLPPCSLEIKKLNINGIAKIDSLSVSPSILSLFTGKLTLHKLKLVRPELTYEHGLSAVNKALAPAQVTGSPVSVSGGASAASASSPIPSKKNPLVIFEHLTIKDGKINFIDHSAGKDGIIITARNINFSLNNRISFPFSMMTTFDLSARIPWCADAQEGKVEARGWVDFFKKDMRATLRIKDIDGIYLYPYYSQWVDLEKARIESAKLAFTSEITGKDNFVVAQNHLELTDIVRKPRAAEEPQEKAARIADAVLDAFKMLNSGKIVLDFTIRTKMDKPQFGFNLVKNAFEDKMTLARNSRGFGPEEVVIIPAKLIGGTLRGATGFSKALLQGTLVFGKEIKKSMESSFKKAKPVACTTTPAPATPAAAAPAPAQEEKKE